jgi:hypothetical protein
MFQAEIACRGKQAMTRELAKSVAERMRRGRNWRKRHGTTHVYKCRACGSWHVGGEGRSRDALWRAERKRGDLAPLSMDEEK